MKLKNIKIDNLFGLEQNNFDIELYPDEKITILYGFNGVGKTSIIKLINASISCNLAILFNMKFSKVIITFEDNSKVEIKRDSDLPARILRMRAKRENMDAYHPISFKFIETTGIEKSYNFRLVGSEKHIAHEYLYPQCLDDESKIKIREIQDILLKKIDLHSILANRDFNRIINPELFGNRVKFNERNQNQKLVICSKIEAKSIYNCLKQQLENDAHNNPLQFYPNANLSFSSVPEEFYYYAQIEDKLEELNKKIYESKDVYLTDEKISLFENIVNNKMGLLYKNVRLTNKELILENIYNDDPPIGRNMLSSGEKNIICLFLELIFLSKENSVFFIDEPETSLHISWQSKLVKSFFDVCKNKNIQIIIATHSPDVIDAYELITTDIVSERYKHGNKYFDN